MNKIFAAVFVSMLVPVASFAQMTFNNLKPLPLQRNPIASKLNFPLERAIAEAQNAHVDLRSIFIVGMMRVTPNINTPELARALFQDQNTVVRTLIPDRESIIVTFTSSLFGVMNAANTNSVFVINMSQRLGGTAGMTVRN